MKWVVTILVALFLVSPALASEKTAELVGAPVGYSSQPTVPIWHPSRDVLWDNGPLVTHPGGAAGGADGSVVQTSLGMTLYGFGHQFSLGYLMADDFTVPAGANWQIDRITFFAYQTGSSTVSSITGVYFQIYDGQPGAGGTPIFGDLTTNRMVSTAWSGIYRTLDTDLRTATNRPIMADVAEPGAVLALAPGTYWIAWCTNGTLSSGPWAPPVTILGQTTTGSALQYISPTWSPAVDGGTGTQQGMPFVIEGNPGSTATEASTWSAVKGLYQ